MSEFLGDGFVDTFRDLYPEKTGSYTYWTYMSNCRAKNVGWYGKFECFNVILVNVSLNCNFLSQETRLRHCF